MYVFMHVCMYAWMYIRKYVWQMNAQFRICPPPVLLTVRTVVRVSIHMCTKVRQRRFTDNSQPSE